MKQGNVPIFVFNVVSLEDDATLELSSWVRLRELGAPFDANFKDAANMGLFALGLSFSTYVVPFTDEGFIPASCLAEFIPLLEHGV